ncbi:MULTISPECIES: hypothetical protein [Paraburkholderia]|uniref:Uncharacterized protein n=1 Tax=Paraburkholderia tropica TaxID=92647 RepID=A0AAQ1JTR5_9BURK|nr:MULTISPECIES: hypothetical protein [Paraburkholderia]MDE1140037.1 hypothetical protein [Paraburkholderia tropica]PXX17972.1 hypothetical protein C7400_10534 [Paraburkholderia tropica]PZW85954.1 hypothetical protein C7399_10534 [Paraburkholderia tropica]SEJ57324.1 hypothetical protein SAMN05216550_10634 [Paraburkholderia tropica]
MKRLLALFALLAGGLATEVAHPLSCTLMSSTRREKREGSNAAAIRRSVRRQTQPGV